MNVMLKKNNYSLRVRLSGNSLRFKFKYYRIDVFRNRSVFVNIGFYDCVHNIIFIKFNVLIYLLKYSLSLRMFLDASSAVLSKIDFSSFIFLGLYRWILNKEVMIIPKAFWTIFLTSLFVLVNRFVLINCFKFFSGRFSWGLIFTKRFKIIDKLK